MSATLNERMAPTLSTGRKRTRVAIREVREASFRALVAVGASNAEAKVAAEQVLHTELHRGSGLSVLLEDLASGPWVRAGLACSRDESGERPVLRVTGAGRPGALRQGAMLVELLAAEAVANVVVVSDGLAALSPLLDEPLIRAAQATGYWVVATDRTATSTQYRVAAPDGGIAAADVANSGDPQRDQSHVPNGVSLFRRDLQPDWSSTWLTAATQRSTRATAAQHGVSVDTAVWTAVKTAAAAYLVPEL